MIDFQGAWDAPDEEVLQNALSAPEGDLRAFEELVRRHRKHTAANCKYITRDDNNAEDLTQEIFVKAYFALKTFEGRSSFGHWLRRIKVHHCLNYLKKQGGVKQVTIEDENRDLHEQLQVPPAALREMEAAGLRQQIGEILEALPTTLRLPLILRDMDDLSYEEIASELNVGLSAVKMRIKRARAEFRRRYEALSDEVKMEPHLQV